MGSFTLGLHNAPRVGGGHACKKTPIRELKAEENYRVDGHGWQQFPQAA